MNQCKILPLPEISLKKLSSKETEPINLLTIQVAYRIDHMSQDCIIFIKYM